MRLTIHAALALLTSVFFVACGGSSFPTLSIELSKTKDSIGYALLQGDSLSRLDTLRFEGEAIELSPDTSLYKEAYVYFGDNSDEIRYYKLSGDSWQRATPTSPKATQPKKFPDFYSHDIERKAESLTELTRGRIVAFSFADSKGKSLTKGEEERLRKTYGKDSLRLVYLYPITSNDEVRRLMKQDSLKGIAFSDSLGEVTRLRDSLGIARSPKAHTFIVDSNRLIIKR